VVLVMFLRAGAELRQPGRSSRVLAGPGNSHARNAGASMADGHDDEAITNALDQLHRAGWSIGSTAFGSTAGGLVWVVSGVNGENGIRAEGATEGEAWRGPLEQARTLGMLGASSRVDPGGGGVVSLSTSKMANGFGGFGSVGSKRISCGPASPTGAPSTSTLASLKLRDGEMGEEPAVDDDRSEDRDSGEPEPEAVGEADRHALDAE
jgi:hypothetical protein